VLTVIVDEPLHAHSYRTLLIGSNRDAFAAVGIGENIGLALDCLGKG